MKESDQRFLAASHRMTEAWKEMTSSGQLKRYSGRDKDGIEIGEEKGSSAEGDDYIVQYLTALQDLLEASKA